MIDLTLKICFGGLVLAILLALYRLARGPTVLDRILAFDLIAISVVGMIVLLSVLWHTPLYVELILIFSLLGFFSTLAFVFYLHKTHDIEAHQDAASNPDTPETPRPMTEIITSILLLTGVAWIVTAAIGAVRLPDVLCRSHAVAKALTLGIFLMLLGLWAHLGSGTVGLKIVLAMLFQITTIPLASHLIALLARQKNLPRWQPPRTSKLPADCDRK